MPLVADLAAAAPPPHVLAPPSSAVTWRPVVVRPGDTVWQLAITHRTTPGEIVARNALPAGGSLLQVGQHLLVPAPAPAGAPAPAPAPAPGSAATGSYTVRGGDTLSDIASRHGLGVAALASANAISNPRMIFPGQRLTIPGAGAPSAPAPAPASPAAPAGLVHVVRGGDTMVGIADRYGVTLTKLLAANRLPNPRMIYAGQRITIPTAAAKPTAAGTSSAPTPTSANTFAGYTFSDATVRAANASRAALAARPVPSRAETAAMIRRTALRHGVDPRLALAVSWQESGWNQRAVSVANAIGTMQVMPTSGTWASELAGRPLDLLDTQDNITAGVVILRALQASAADRDEAIAGYYQGLASVQSRGMFEDTKGYVKAVQAHYDRM
ncbi:MAG TPA: LysM peptidoglycan-binding domain-containing protein [Intrasporangium sp.]|uniref:LysM peptidoglycan-binding domain-containing protein n=1 Tax=Intrasporangium sp. TaxID=1925024 RepID=UPI002D776F3E|nr:LysM peptidoglycan-binding domain-containing protein [Intrasporangium sp.]HET7397431.1 LysM peptidoglycan-binding domain-containing protein [Intrasporangium sp.]